MQTKAPTIWVLAADSAKAQVLVNNGPGQGLKALSGATFEGSHRTDQELYSDRAGRESNPSGGGSHAMDHASTAAQQERENFARSLCKWLGDPARKDKFDRLAIVAAPKMLGELRNLLPEGVRSKIVCELDKDLTAAKPDEIARALGDKIIL